MKSISTKKIVPLVTFFIGAVWAYLGIFKYSWMNEGTPGSGFFPTIIAVLLMVASLIALINDFKSEKVVYLKRYMYPIIAVLAIVLASYLIGLTLSIFLYLIYWLGFYEKYPMKLTMVFSISTTVVVYGVFVLWLKVPFPTGFLGIL